MAVSLLPWQPLLLLPAPLPGRPQPGSRLPSWASQAVRCLWLLGLLNWLLPSASLPAAWRRLLT